MGQKTLCLFFFLIFLWISLPSQSQSLEEIQQANLITPELEKAIRRGLDFLARSQDPADGSLSRQYKLAVTSLAGLAFLAHPSSSYLRGPYGKNIAGVLRYILSLAKDSEGRIRYQPGLGIWLHDGQSQGRMHAHCYATLFLAEVYGTIRSKRKEREVRAVLRGAIDLLIHSQTYGVKYKNGKKIEWGGWGYYHKYEPKSNEDEASVTICALQALRAARNAGLWVPKSTIERAINYVKLCMKKDGSFRYSLARGMMRSSYELTAAAVSTLNAAGVYKSYELDRGLLYLRKSIEEERRVGGSADEASQNWYYYGNLYAAQAFFQAGDTLWKPWFREVSQALLRKQQPNGSWLSRRFGREYATAMALLILQIPYRTLPIFQR